MTVMNNKALILNQFIEIAGRMSHQNNGDDMSSNNIIIGATPSHWNNDGRGTYIYNSIITHEEFLMINCWRVKASDIGLPRAQQISIHSPK